MQCLGVRKRDDYFKVTFDHFLGVISRVSCCSTENRLVPKNKQTIITKLKLDKICEMLLMMVLYL